MDTNQKGSTYLHQQTQKRFIVEAQAYCPELHFIPMTVGMFRDFVTAERIIRVGEVGTFDVLILGNKKYMFFDTKTGNARLTKEQKIFKSNIDRLNSGEICFVLRNIPEALEIMRRYFYGE